MDPENILKEVVCKYEPLTQQQWGEFLRIFEERSYKSGDTILKKGDVYDSYYFLCKGALRLHDEVNGKDTTLNLIVKPRFMADLVSMTEQSPTKVHLSTAAQSTVLIVKRKCWEEIASKDVVFERLARKLMEQFFLEGAERMHALLFLSPEERYEMILKNSPELIRFVAQKYLASFFNITPQSLSRLKRRMFKGA